MIDLEQIRAAEARYAQRDREGESPQESAERTAKRIARVTSAEAFTAGGPTAALVEAVPGDSADTGRVALERLLGRNDLMSILYLERGEGPVARATLYFLVRYPDLINRPHEYDEDRIEILKQWHRDSPPGKYEKHGNWAVNERQGNRNPFIDHPDWVDQVDFAKGLG